MKKLVVLICSALVATVAARANALTVSSGEAYAVGTKPVALAVADVNHDGVRDVVSLNNGSSTASVLLGDAAGGFRIASSPSVVSQPVAFAMADINGDAQPDLITVGTANGNIHFRFGNGTGSFPTTSKFQSSSTTLSALAVGDLNADGKTDVVTDAPNGAVRVLLGNGSGGFNFAPGSPFAARQAPTTLAVADMNGDRWPDVVAASATGGTVSVLRGSSTGALTLAAERTLGSRPTALAIRDLDGDGDTDVAVALPDAAEVAVLLGDGAGNLDDGSSLSAPSGSRSIAAGDMNDDGIDDLIVASDTTGEMAIEIGDGAGRFTSSVGSPFAVSGAPDAVAVLDADADGVDDVALARVATNDVIIERDTSSRGLVATPSSVDFGPQGVGTTSDARSVTASSDGLASRITSVTVDGDYVVARDGCTGRTIGDGYPSCAVSVAFAPSDVGERDGSLVLSYGIDDSQSVPLTGVGIDITPPETTITGYPSELTNDPSPTFTFESDDATASFECGFDAADYIACASPDSASLSDGDHAFSVRAIDPAGNVDPTPASASFTIDTQSPVSTITSGPSDPTREGRPGFTFTADDDGATFECRMDDDAFASCESPYRSGALSDGEHTFAVRASDAAGNTEEPPVTDTFTVDTTAPDTTITDHPSAQTTDDAPSFSFAADESGDTFECALDGDPFASCESPYVTPQLDPGPHNFSVRATDDVGNTDATPATYSFTVVVPDTQAPGTTITEHPDPLTNDTTPTFRFISDEAGVTFVCDVDGGGSGSCGSPFTTGVLSEGRHTFSVSAVDAAGNVDPTPDSFVVTIDLTKPHTTIQGPARSTRDNARFIFRFSENVQTVRCSMDGSGYSECRTPYSGRALRPGKHVLKVRAIDAAGNSEASPAIKRFTIVRGK